MQAGLKVPRDLEVIIAKRDYSLVLQATELVPDEFVEAFCWAGTPEMVAERIIAVARDTRVEEFGLWLLLASGQTREEAVQLLASEVLPRIQASLS